MSAIEDLGLPPAPEPLPKSIIDNHTHYSTVAGYSGLAAADAISLAKSVGVSGSVDVGCDVESSQQAVALAEANPSVVAAVALHPNDVGALYLAGGEELVVDHFDQLKPLAERSAVRAVGETGLDYFRTRDQSAQLAQQRWFRSHIELACDNNLTLVIHDRDAHDDVLRVLDEGPLPPRVVMHCFSGDVAFAEACLARGFWLSFPGIVTFPSAGVLRGAALATPSDKILIETDAPYLTPVPQRGKPNSPYLLPHTARFLAELRGEELNQFCDQVTANTFAAFGGRWGDDD